MAKKYVEINGEKMEVKKAKKPFYKRVWVWGLGLIIVASIASGGGEETETVATGSSANEAKQEVKVDEGKKDEAKVEPVKLEAPKVEAKAEPKQEKPKKPELTLSQQNAISKAESYLDFSAFSKTGLIEQLEYEGFSNAEATFAVDNITVDWNEQAVQKGKSYLDMSSFSRSGLIEQLTFEGFTNEEVTHAVNVIGL